MRPDRVARRVWRGVALAGLGVAGGVALVTARHRMMTPQPLQSGLPGTGHLDRRHGGEIYYTVAGPQDGRPVVLLHGFYPGASNYEYRAVFDRLAETYRVYAPDWLGFGMSERPRLMHTGEFYVSMLRGFLRDVVGAPATVVAHGLAGNVAATAASEEPDLFERLILVAPDAEAGMRPDPTLSQTLSRAFQKFSAGLAPYAIVSSRPALRLAAGRRSAVGPMQVDDATLDHLYASAHQFGGEHATLSWLTGELDLPLRHLFALLTTPTLIMIGVRDQARSQVEMERLVALNRHADLEVVPNAGETVYLDQPRLFVNTMRRWMARRAPRIEPVAVEETRPIAPSAAAALPSSSATPTPPVEAVEYTAKVVPVVSEAGASEVAPPTAAVAAVKVIPVLEQTAQRSAGAERGALSTRQGEPTNAASVPRSQKSQSTPPTMRGPTAQPNATIGRQRAISPSSVSSRAQPSTFTYAPQTKIHTLRTDQGGRSTRQR
ncbi:MAG TPA: alpha/beta hydrolase [Ktedonobacterales bacterium]